MKLNKVLALALSGVMAVSMLAGCSNNSSDNEQENNQGAANTNAVVAAVEDVQEDNEAVVPFEYSSELEEALDYAIRMEGVNSGKNAVRTQLMTILGGDYVEFNGMRGYNSNHATNVGEDATVSVCKITGNKIESAAVKEAAEEINQDLDDLIDEFTSGGITYTYNYSGETAMVSCETPTGGVVYYIAYVVNCNTTSALAA